MVLVSGPQSVNTATNTVSVEVSNLNPQASSDEIGVFATLPINPVEERTVHIEPDAGGAAPAALTLGPSVSVSISPEVDSAYPLHRIEFPGYTTTSAGASGSIAVTIKTATIFERVSTPSTGGNSFPAAGASVFVVETDDDAGSPTAFTDPVNIRVEFKPGDKVDFSGSAGGSTNMRLVSDSIDGAEVDFQFTGATPAIFDLLGTAHIEVTGVTNLTGASGAGTWGAVANLTVPGELSVFAAD
jgi:hypothetical protein